MTSRDRRRRTDQAGFTLIELLVVLAILALIASFAVPQVMKYLGGARGDAARVQLQHLGTNLDLYRLENGRYPTTEEGLLALVEKPQAAARWSGPYVKRKEQLLDPWGTPYAYRHPGRNAEYDLWSLGADGKEGGDGESRDVVSW